MSIENKKIGIWWIRRDLRLHDNLSLLTALEENDFVVPLFILDPELIKIHAPNRKNFLFSCLDALNQEILKFQGGLIVRTGPPYTVFQMLKNEIGPFTIYAEEDFTPYSKKRDLRIAREFNLCLVKGITLHPPEAVLKQDNSPYTIFTPYKNAWKSLVLPTKSTPTPEHIPFFKDVISDQLPVFQADNTYPPGENEGLTRLRTFIDERVNNYKETRNRMDLAGTSQLSPYLHFGVLSIRNAFWAAYNNRNSLISEEKKNSIDTWINELVWREFFYMILHFYPEVLHHSFRTEYRNISWSNNHRHLIAWQQGKTGFPIVDAAMRQLLDIGWMHNRARMIVASFLVKDLLINWQLGEKWFLQHLVDGDLASNNGGWQWSAGVGTDSAPYFRIFNPIIQSKKFDPLGHYIRKYVPELRRVPEKYIHEPWDMPKDIQIACGCIIGKDYPARIVDHNNIKNRTILAYKAARN